MNFSIPPRAGIVVWLRDYKRAKALEPFGVVHYVSRKMRYAILYVNYDDVEQVMVKIKRLPFVKNTERSYRHEIRTDYSTKQLEQDLFA